MPYSSLRDFLDRLEADGQLVRITEQVSTDREITEIHRRTLHAGGPALLFENVVKEDGTPSEMPVLVNLFGTVERVARGVTLDGKERRTAMDLREVGQLMAFLRQPEPPEGIKEALGLLPLAKTVLQMRPKWRTDRALRRQTAVSGGGAEGRRDRSRPPADPDLLAGRAGAARHLAAGRHPRAFGQEGGRLQPRHLPHAEARQEQADHALAEASRRRAAACALEEGEDRALPAAAVLGADPGTDPGGGDAGAGQFLGVSFRRHPARQAGGAGRLRLPAAEGPGSGRDRAGGTVSLDEYADEGPYGDHTGYYNSVEQFPVFTVTAMTMREKPIYLSTYTGRPPDEPSVLGEALNEVFIPLLQQQFPEIVDFWLPPEGCSYRIAVISMKKAYAGHAKRVMMGAWSYLRQFMYTKWVIVVDADVNARDWKDVWWAITTKMDPARDITVLENTPIDYLDFASPVSGLGSKIGLDATDKTSWGSRSDMICGADDLASDLRTLGVEPGDGLFVHTALGRVGSVIGGPRGLIEALVAAVGPTGLIGMPGFSKDAYDPIDLLDEPPALDDAQRAAIRAQVPGFDPQKSDVRDNGAVPEAFRSWPGVIRSPHPTSSVLLLGEGAAEMAARHDPSGWATGPETPWGRLRARPNMKILLIGVGWNRCSALHAAESVAAHRRTKMRHFKSGPGDAPWLDAPDVADDLDRLFPLVGAAWEATGAVDLGRMGEAECRITAYDPLVAFASDWISRRNAEDGVPAFAE